MRILQFETVDRGWGGTEVHVIRLTDGLLRRGHTVGVVAAKDSLILRECQEIGAQALPFHLCRRGEWRKLPGLLRLIRAFRPDVAHCHTPVDLGLVSLAARILRVPCRVCTRHGIPRFSNPRSARMYSRLFHRFIAVSEFARRVNVEEYGLPAAQVVTIYPGLDASAFPAEPAAPGPVRVALVGRMSEEKGHELFLRSLTLYEGVVGVFVGDGPLRGHLEALATELSVQNRVEWVGSQADVRPWIAGSHVLCVPSVKDEAMPWVLLEGMACSRAVVVSDTGGLPEVVEPDFGIVVPFAGATHPQERLARAFAELASDPGRRSAMGTRAREVVEKRFSLDRLAEETEALYRDVLGTM